MHSLGIEPMTLVLLVQEFTTYFTLQDCFFFYPANEKIAIELMLY